MEIALIILVVNIVIAVVDLSVGVANDAVNFLNSAVGSKVSSYRKALIFASVGILIGVTLSSGMMEIARKGIFNPSAFTLFEVMVIFLATALTDIILLDFFNTFGIPTSTTVSMISALTGGALAITLVHLVGENQPLENLSLYMNLGKLTAIYVSIVLSIIFAFVFGYLGQFFSRLIFSFDYREAFKKIGPIWSAFAFTFILFFISVKGLEGASFITKETQLFITSHRWELLGLAFILFTFIFYVGLWLRFDILKFIVLIGTSALALSFASNDLINFVGPALSSLFAYQSALNNPDPLNMKMDALANPIVAPTEFLLLSGLVMVITLFLSKKARNVTSTEVNLGRQYEGYEAFETFPFARFVVRISTSFANNISKILPKWLVQKVNERFDSTKVILLKGDDGTYASFDLIRATVNLTIASALISLGTSLKLPLSTTYVTFIVAMSTAFADRAWGRDYAVYRISGILTVIGGWLLTAVICGIISGVITLTIFYTKIFGVAIFVGLTILSLARTTIIFKKREKEKQREEEKLRLQKENAKESFKIFVQDTLSFLMEVKEITNLCISGISKFRFKELKKAKKQSETLRNKVDVIFSDFAKSIKGFDDTLFENSHTYASAMADLTTIASNLTTVTERCFEYLDNYQKPLTDNQVSDLRLVTKFYNQMFDKILAISRNSDAKLVTEVVNFEKEFHKEIKRIHNTYMKAMKRPGANTKRGILYISLIENLYVIVNKVLNLITILNQLQARILAK